MSVRSSASSIEGDRRWQLRTAASESGPKASSSRSRRSNRRSTMIPQALKFIGHPLRRKMLLAMADSNLTASELARKIRASLSAVRYHLSVMEARNMADVNRSAKPHRYRFSAMVRVLFYEDQAVIAIRPSAHEEVTLRIPNARERA